MAHEGGDPELVREAYQRGVGQLAQDHRRLRTLLAGASGVAFVFFVLGFGPYVTNQETVLATVEGLASGAAERAKREKERQQLERRGEYYEALAEKFRVVARRIQDEIHSPDFPEIRHDLAPGDPENRGFAEFHRRVKSGLDGLLREVTGRRRGARMVHAGMVEEVRAHFALYDDLMAGEPERWMEFRFGAQPNPSDDVSYLFVFAASEIVLGWRQRVLDPQIRAIDEILDEIAERDREAVDERAGSERMLEQVRELANLETPIGRLPLGFLELTLYFPLLCLLGYAPIRLRQGALERLHGAVLELGRRRDPAGRVLDARGLAVLGHGAVDSGSRSWARAGRCATIAVLPALTLASIAMLQTHPRVLDQLGSSGRVPLGEHVNTLGFALILLGAAALLELVVAALLRRGTKQPAPADPAPPDPEAGAGTH